MVIWITGLSASGKTTLSRAFIEKYRSAIPCLVLLDGDVIRQLYGNDLGHSEADRTTQIRRIQTLAAFLEQQSILVVVAALYARGDLLDHNRKHFDQYFEVYLQADVDFVKTRDRNGLYEKAFNKDIDNVVGVDIPWHAPVSPDLVFDMTAGQPPEEMAAHLYRALFANAT